MENSTKNSPTEAVTFPHNGQLLTNFILSNRINRVALAQKMNIEPSTIYNYVKSTTLQLSILWNASQALNHNFVAYLGELLPVEYVTKKEKELQLQVESLKKEIENLNLEISVYKSIVGK